MIETSVYLIIAGVVILLAYIKFVMIPKKILEAKIEEREKNIVASEPRNDPVFKNDFYGTDKLLNDPSGFIKKAIESKDKLSKGEEISVDAVQAFYLIRNVEHHNLIVGETGTINFKTLEESVTFDDDKMVELQQRIIEFEKDETSNKITFQVPEYVKEVVTLKDGGVRWIFTDEHSNWCGIKSQCFDKYDRAMPDPDAVIDEQKNKGRERHQDGAQKNDQTRELSKKLSRMIEMEEERRVDAMLSPVQTVSEDKTVEKVINGTSTLIPSEYIDEIDELSNEHTIPNFDDFFEDDLSEKELLACDNLSSAQSENEEHPEITEVNDEDKISKIDYSGIEDLCMLFAHDKKYFDLIVKSLFFKNGDGYLFIDFENGKIFIEKNYFVRNLLEHVNDETKNKFKKDFLSQGAIDIFDGNKINSIINAIDCEAKFDRFGRGNSQVLWNMLFKVIDVDDLYISGWFIKLDIDSIDAIDNYIAKHARGSSIEVISNLPKEIKHQIKLINSVKVFY